MNKKALAHYAAGQSCPLFADAASTLVEGNYSSSSDYHACVAPDGYLVELVTLAGGPDNYDSGNDATALATSANALG